MIPIFLAIVPLVLIGLWLALTYNGFVKLRNQIAEAWSGIDVQLKKRHDLIPNIVQAVQGYAAHEKKVLQDVTEARTRALAAQDVAGREQAETALTHALGNLFAVAEAYPGLKASQNFLQLQRTLTEVEDEIALARRYYNAVVRNNNIKCQSFPSLIAAGIFKFKEHDFFQAEAGERGAVQVKL